MYNAYEMFALMSQYNKTVIIKKTFMYIIQKKSIIKSHSNSNYRKIPINRFTSAVRFLYPFTS